VKPRSLRAVTFDCWNTLLLDQNLDAARSLRVEALARAARSHRVEVDAARALAAIRGAHARHVELWSRGVGSGSPEMAAWALESLGIVDAPLAAELGSVFEEAGVAGEARALPGAVETLQALRARGVRIALICDTGFSPGRIVRRFLARESLLELLEVQVFSDEVGVPKPHPRMFERALRPLGVAGAEAVHVGDLKRTDVQGGRRAGMGTVRIRGAYDDPDALPDADRVIDAHVQLAGALEELAAG
jgi:putative hydrolase of the HAD superfamily